jgi:hypothetical protein
MHIGETAIRFLSSMERSFKGLKSRVWFIFTSLEMIRRGFNTASLFFQNQTMDLAKWNTSSKSLLDLATVNFFG